MFAPEGYVSLSSLWEEFLGKYRIRLSAIARERYREKTFGQHDEFGSPDDFCEDVFLQLIEKEIIWAVRSSAPAMKLSTQLDGGRSALFSKLTVLESCFAAENPVEAGPDGYWLHKMGSSHFKAYWDLHRPSLSWRENYPTEEGGLPFKTPLCFHTLPWAFERARFLVPNKVPPWSEDVVDEHFILGILKSFAGASLCLVEDDAERWRAKHIGKGAFLWKMGLEDGARRNVGRPRMLELVQETYFRLYPSGHRGTLKEVCLDLENVTGKVVSTKTLQRAIKAGPIGDGKASQK